MPNSTVVAAADGGVAASPAAADGNESGNACRTCVRRLNTVGDAAAAGSHTNNARRPSLSSCRESYQIEADKMRHGGRSRPGACRVDEGCHYTSQAPSIGVPVVVNSLGTDTGEFAYCVVVRSCARDA